MIQNQEIHAIYTSVYVDRKEITTMGYTTNIIHKRTEMSRHLSSTPENIIIVVIVKTLPRWDLGSLPGKGRIVKPNIQQTNLEPVRADKID